MCSVTGTCMSFNNTCNIAEMSNGACLSIICEKSLASARLVDFQCLKSGRRQQQLLVRTMLKLVVKLHASRMTRAVTFNSQQFARFRRTGLGGGRVKAATHPPPLKLSRDASVLYSSHLSFEDFTSKQVHYQPRGTARTVNYRRKRIAEA